MEVRAGRTRPERSTRTVKKICARQTRKCHEIHQKQQQAGRSNRRRHHDDRYSSDGGAGTPGHRGSAVPPSRPTGLVATGVQGYVQLSWNGPQDDSITHYKVFRRNVSPGVQETMQTLTANTGGSTNSYTDSTAEPGTRYKYKVAAVNAEGQSKRSRTATITTPPAQVQDVSAAQEAGDTAVDISWTSVDTATTYQVERETTSDLSADPVVTGVAAPTASYEDTGTDYDTEYLYRVRAGNDSGYGEWSELDRITTAREPGTPAAPARVELSEDDAGSVVITWQDPPGDEDVNEYRVYRKTVATNTDQQLETTNGTTTTYTDSTVA